MLTRNQRAGINAAARNRDFMARTGLTYAGDKIWTEMEVATIRAAYPDYEAAQCALPHRSLKAIMSKARRSGITKPRRVWRPGEFSGIKPQYVGGTAMAEILPAVPAKTAPQVYSKASSRKVRRPRKPPKDTGLSIVDTVRRRAFDLRLSMADLDALVGSGSYFRRPRVEKWRHLNVAIKLLGGTIEVVGL